MKATTQLKVTPDMRVAIQLDLTVEEMDALLEATKEISRWPMGRFRECFRQALSSARAAYSSDHVLE